MRPNTLVLGFYDDSLPRDKLVDPTLATIQCSDQAVPSLLPDNKPPLFHFPGVRGSGGGDRQDGGESGDGKALGVEEYVAIIADAVKMLKNVALARHFDSFERSRVLSGGGAVYVDVWPVNLLRPDSSGYVDTSSLFLLQLACILNMVRAWRKATLRLFLCVEAGGSVRNIEEKLGHLLSELRIKAQLHPVNWDQQVALHWQRQAELDGKKAMAAAGGGEEEEGEDDYANSFPSNATRISDDFLLAVNHLIRDSGSPAPAVRFLYLPRPPADTRRYATYLRQLELLTRDLGPTLLIHGVTPVITTDL